MLVISMTCSVNELAHSVLYGVSVSGGSVGCLVRKTSDPISERRTGVQVRNFERVGNLIPGKPIRATAKRRGPAAVGSSR